MNDSSSRRPAARMTSFTLRDRWVKSPLIRLRPCRPRRAVAPVPAQHQAADALALERIQFGHQFGVERHAASSNSGTQFSSWVFSWITRTHVGRSFGR